MLGSTSAVGFMATFLEAADLKRSHCFRQKCVGIGQFLGVWRGFGAVSGLAAGSCGTLVRSSAWKYKSFLLSHLFRIGVRLLGLAMSRCVSLCHLLENFRPADTREPGSQSDAAEGRGVSSGARGLRGRVCVR